MNERIEFTMLEQIKGYIDALIYLISQFAALLGIEFGKKEGDEKAE